MQPASRASHPEHSNTKSGPPSLGRDALRLEALGLMTAGIVHDLGNMVQVLSSAVTLLGRHPDVRTASGLEAVMSGAKDSLERAHGLIQQILGFARGDGAEEQDLDVTLCVAAMEQPLRWITPLNVTLQLDLAADAPRLRCNRRDFENAMLNLLLNACDAMPNGGLASIAIAAAERLGGMDADLTVCVTDTGSGMAPEVLARACEPFFTTKPGSQGTGLGLAMVRQFAQAAGGGMTIHSKVGVGTTVTLRFPVVTEH